MAHNHRRQPHHGPDLTDIIIVILMAVGATCYHLILEVLK